MIQRAAFHKRKSFSFLSRNTLNKFKTVLKWCIKTTNYLSGAFYMGEDKETSEHMNTQVSQLSILWKFCLKVQVWKRKYRLFICSAALWFAQEVCSKGQITIEARGVEKGIFLYVSDGRQIQTTAQRWKRPHRTTRAPDWWTSSIWPSWTFWWVCLHCVRSQTGFSGVKHKGAINRENKCISL